DHYRQRQARFHLLGLRVERLAELHDVEAALAQRRADRRRGVRLGRGYLQLDESNNLLRHASLLVGSSGHRSALPGYYAFSTWPNSSSTGVERPKIVTATRKRLFS